MLSMKKPNLTKYSTAAELNQVVPALRIKNGENSATPEISQHSAIDPGSRETSPTDLTDHESPSPADAFSVTADSDFTEEPKCRHGIPLAVAIPRGDNLCPFLGERRGSFYRLINDGVLIKLRTRGLREGVSSVYGPSVCDAKYGCRCGHRHNLERLRHESQKGVRL